MGNQSSNNTIVNQKGVQIKRKSIILVIPPGFQVSKMIQGFPQQFPYKYVSIGDLIRNEINKKTKYSQLILQALQKNKKISKNMLQILLKTVALRGDFIIRYSVLDSDQLSVWKQFMSKVQIQLLAIIKPSAQEDILQQQNDNANSRAKQRLTSFYNDVSTAKSTFLNKKVIEFSQRDDISSQIMTFIRKSNI